MIEFSFHQKENNSPHSCQLSLFIQKTLLSPSKECNSFAQFIRRWLWIFPFPTTLSGPLILRTEGWWHSHSLWLLWQEYYLKGWGKFYVGWSRMLGRASSSFLEVVLRISKLSLSSFMKLLSSLTTEFSIELRSWWICNL